MKAFINIVATITAHEIRQNTFSSYIHGIKEYKV